LKPFATEFSVRNVLKFALIDLPSKLNKSQKEVLINHWDGDSMQELKQNRMHKKERGLTEDRRRAGINPMRWFQTGILMAALSVSCVAQDAAKPAEAQSSAATPAATQTANLPKGVEGVDNERYVIGPDDSLSITVWKEPNLSGTIPVRPDGMISMALIGDLKAAGRTPMQLAGDITTKLKKYIQDPNVSVVVMSVTSQRIFMIGEVGHAGPIAMTPGMTPLQAIAAGGGLSPFANSKKIYILRNENGKQVKIPFNYKKALKGEDSENVELKPGDTIIVP
jgi:polysaccharide export outer membrane protein